VERNLPVSCNWDREFSTTTWNPSVDIFENDNEVVIKVELPGMDAKDIEVRLENNVLALKGERRFEKEKKEENYHRVEREYGVFSRSFSLPAAVNGDKGAAEYNQPHFKHVSTTCQFPHLPTVYSNAGHYNQQWTLWGK
jgi:HSP20 family molecular chaperone IbpA